MIFTQAVREIRTKELSLTKKYPFDLKFTYWDSDELSLLMKLEKTPVFYLNRGGADLVITANPEYKHPTKFTVRPDQLIELFVTSPDHVQALFMTQETFREFGGIDMLGLTSPGIEEMKAWCFGMDAEIVRVAKELKARNQDQIFRKIFDEMGGSILRDSDRVARRIRHLVTLTELFKQDESLWRSEMRHLGLLR